MRSLRFKLYQHKQNRYLKRFKIFASALKKPTNCFSNIIEKETPGKKQKTKQEHAKRSCFVLEE
jgi:hypothetical protein